MKKGASDKELERAGRITWNRVKPLQPIPKTREQRLRAAKRLTQAVVKVASYASGKARVRATIRYVARAGGLLMEDESGLTLTSWEEIEEVLAVWSQDYGQQAKVNRGKKGRDAMHLVLSMPKGSDREGARRSVRAFAAEQFSGNHQYLFTMHEDTAHPHGHLIVKTRGFDGKSLRTNKEILQGWRDQFAEQCRQHNINVDASSRLSRGVGRRGSSLRLIKTTEKLPKSGNTVLVEHLRPEKKDSVDKLILEPWEARAKQITNLEREGLKQEAQLLMEESAVAESGEQREALERSAVKLLVYAKELPEPMSLREQYHSGSNKELGQAGRESD